MNVTGVMIYYYFICERRLWYFSNQINTAQDSELVQIGKIIDETTYQREKKNILIDNTINIDFVGKEAVLHEIKKSKSLEEAGIWQLKYYIYYLEQKGIKNINAEMDFPLLRETKKIVLEDEDRNLLKNVVENIKNIVKQDKPPKVIDSKICKKCSYYDLCYV